MEDEKDTKILIYSAVDLDVESEVVAAIARINIPKPTPEEDQMLKTFVPGLANHLLMVYHENESLIADNKRDSDAALEIASEVEERAYESEQRNEELVKRLASILELNEDYRAEIKSLEEQKDTLQDKLIAESLDDLTGLPDSKDSFFESLDAELSRAARYGTEFSLLIVDADKFKDVNDTYGHLAGDRVLKAMGRVIRENLRDSDIGCRYGGEEIAILLPETNQYGAHRVAEKIRTAMECISYEGIDRNVTVSIGTTTFNPSHDRWNDYKGVDSVHGNIDRESFFNRADQAMYASKEDGRNSVSTAAYSDERNPIIQIYNATIGHKKGE